MQRNSLSLEVTCYAGYRGEETPRTFLIHERRVEVVDVIDRWLSPQYRYFKVRGSDDNTYVIRHSNSTRSWELI